MLWHFYAQTFYHSLMRKLKSGYTQLQINSRRKSLVLLNCSLNNDFRNCLLALGLTKCIKPQIKIFTYSYNSYLHSYSYKQYCYRLKFQKQSYICYEDIHVFYFWGRFLHNLQYSQRYFLQFYPILSCVNLILSCVYAVLSCVYPILSFVNPIMFFRL